MSTSAEDERDALPDAAERSTVIKAAQLHRQLIEHSLARLQSHTDGLDTVVRDELRRTFISECGSLLEATTGATEALMDLKRTAGRRLAWAGALAAALWSAVALIVMQRLVPTSAELAALRAERQQLLTTVHQLRDSGAGMQLRRCGSQQRLCVRVDRGAPAYGPGGDYLVVKGY